MSKDDNELKAEYWRGIIKECNNRGTGSSKDEWLKQNHIKRTSFYKWQRIFRSEAAGQINEKKKKQKQLPEAPAFVDITPAVQERGPAETPASQPDTLSPEAMILVNGYPVYVNSSIGTGTLETIVRVLKDA